MGTVLVTSALVFLLVLVAWFTRRRPQRKLTGLSLSLCVGDILRGRVKENEVVEIISGIAAPSDEIWEEVLDRYSQTYWRKNPREAKKIANRLKAKGKIKQPRLEGNPYPNIVDGAWVIDGKQQHI